MGREVQRQIGITLQMELNLGVVRKKYHSITDNQIGGYSELPWSVLSLFFEIQPSGKILR